MSDHPPARPFSVYADADSLYQSAADFWVAQAQRAILAHGRFIVALSGGNTPAGLYRLLAQSPWRDAVVWSKVVFFLGDERFVPHTDDNSNYKMITAALLQHLPLMPAQIQLIDTNHATADAAAQAYELVLSKELPVAANGLPEFDLVMLGMGADGHTASLFPGTPALDETEKKVTAVYVEELSVWRISLTLPVINQARQVMVLVCGADKAPVLAEVFQPDSQLMYPIQRVQPVGNIQWFLDEAAASRLEYV
ncbi:MAG: 6-phosphogluconolactonase [Gammaproteobacteria bacterium]|nr:6-phosphogluconolactonase [Gammaproteobacteria bacterium]MDH5653869.1 6-phosphogluconolactonase [Gammaproteobacteria bacterium]